MNEKDLLEKGYKGIKGIPIIQDPGNSERNSATGLWRIKRPVFNGTQCSKCKLCFMFCPDSAISWSEEGLTFNMNTCKGCMICAEECPQKAISEVDER